MEDVEQTGREIIITKHDRPVAQLTPVRSSTENGHFGALSGMIRVVGDLDAPLVTDETNAQWLAKWDSKLRRPR